MEKAGLIESSTSDWAPIVLIKKEGKSMRMCVDYRRLNSVTKVEPYPVRCLAYSGAKRGGVFWMLTYNNHFDTHSEKTCQINY